MWYECRVKYEKQLPSEAKTVTESYLMSALGCTDAEAKITEEMTPFIVGEFEVTKVDLKKYSEVFFNDKSGADKWYELKLAMIVINERDGKEKRSMLSMLQQSESLPEAIKDFWQNMTGTIMDYVIMSVSETKYVDVYKS